MIRAVFVDVYRTLLRVGPCPGDADVRWRILCACEYPGLPFPSLETLHFACRDLVVREHQAASARGIGFPEVNWPAIMQEALGLPSLPAAAFLRQHALLVRSTSLEPGAREFLEAVRGAGVPLGLVSNAQGYTVAELDEALGHDHRQWFEPGLIFWSFEHGFGKPDPYVFHTLTAWLAGRAIPPSEALVIGDRMDNDIEPARAAGFQAWHYGDDWPSLTRRLKSIFAEGTVSARGASRR